MNIFAFSKEQDGLGRWSNGRCMDLALVGPDESKRLEGDLVRASKLLQDFFVGLTEPARLVTLLHGTVAAKRRPGEITYARFHPVAVCRKQDRRVAGRPAVAFLISPPGRWPRAVYVGGQGGHHDK